MHPSATAVRTACSTARWFSTGSAPGSPRQTGQTWLFGGEPNAVLQPQKILVSVRSWAWISSPMTGSNDMGSGDHALGPARRTSSSASASNALKFSANIPASRDACVS